MSPDFGEGYFTSMVSPKFPQIWQLGLLHFWKILLYLFIKPQTFARFRLSNSKRLTLPQYIFTFSKDITEKPGDNNYQNVYTQVFNFVLSITQSKYSAKES